LSVVRGFAAYLHSTDPSAEVIPAGLFRPGVCRATPYLYSDAEIGALIRAAAALQPWLRAATYQALISLLAVSGIFSAGHPLRRNPVSAFAQLRG
ncbi:MAG TPA: hypothetical protein VNO54_09765, partial [Streptosporangiaceae bacterium]|nr:hypothetical protein [Streptosporangiaceae bacterium]